MPDKKTILIVEDEPNIRDILQTMLSQAGYNVLQAEDAETGKQTALEKHPDLMLLDIIMPRVDGLTMLKELREVDAWSKTVPVIILSSLDDPGSLDEAGKCDCQGYIVKTDLTSSVILPRIQEVLSRSKT